MARYGLGPRVRLVSDGTGKGTKLYDLEGNEILKGAVRSVHWRLPEPGELAQVVIELVPLVGIEAEGELAQVTTPMPESERVWVQEDALSAGAQWK